MKNENYITIQGWMINELKLSGAELLIYALIYGFSQDGESKFKGSMQYMANWLGMTRQAILQALNKLLKKGYLNRHETRVKGKKLYDFDINIDAIKDISCKETLHPNYINININNKAKNFKNMFDLENKYRIIGGQTIDMTEPVNLSCMLFSLHQKEFPDYLSGKNNDDLKKILLKWADDIEKLIRIDKKPPDIIRQVIQWVKTPNNFWFQNIESGAKLREKFERLYGQMTTDKQEPKNSGYGKPFSEVVI